MIILPSQIDHIDLSTAHLTISGPDLRAPYVILETAHIVLSLPTSPSLGLTYLDTAHIVLDAKTFPTPLPVVVFMPIASVVLSPISIGYLTTGGDDFNKIINTLRQGGSAPTTPPAFGACDQMDLINAVRAKTSLPAMSHSDSCMQSQLLHAFELGNPLPFEVPAIGTWCGDTEYPDIDPAVSKVLFRFLNFMPNETLQLSSNFGDTWYSHPVPKMNALPAPVGANPYATTYLGSGVIIFSDGGAAGIFYRARKYGLDWQRVDSSDVITDVINKIYTNGGLVAFATKAAFDTQAKLYKSTSRGSSWTLVSNMVGYRDLDNLLFITDDILVCVRGLASGYIALSKSIDGGITWVDKYIVTTPCGYDSPLVMLDGGTILYISNGFYAYEPKNRLFMSIDYGENWSLVSLPSLTGYHTQAIYVGNDTILLNWYAQAGIYRSTDRGLTWTYIMISSYNGSVTLYDCGNGKVVVRVPDYYSVTSYAISYDYGATWTVFTNSPWNENQYAQAEIYIDK